MYVRLKFMITAYRIRFVRPLWVFVIAFFCQTMDLPTANALEVIQTFNQADTSTTWNVPVSLNKFDPALGTLTEVRIGLSTSWSGYADITNNSGSTGSFRVTINGMVALTKSQLANGTLSPEWALVDADSVRSSFFSINNGQTVRYTPSPATWSNSSTTTLTLPADLAEFTGSGTLSTYLQANGVTTVTGPTPSSSNVVTNASGSVTLTYVYTVVPEPSTYALAAIATGVMACIARRREAKRA